MSVDDVLHAIKTEHQRSIAIHGDWSDYSVDRMVSETCKEITEFLGAYTGMDVAGPHGMLAEGAQVANCIVKLLVQLAHRQAAEIGVSSVVIG